MERRLVVLAPPDSISANPKHFFLIVIVQMQRIIYKTQTKRQRQILLTNQSPLYLFISSMYVECLSTTLGCLWQQLTIPGPLFTAKPISLYSYLCQVFGHGIQVHQLVKHSIKHLFKIKWVCQHLKLFMRSTPWLLKKNKMLQNLLKVR